MPAVENGHSSSCCHTRGCRRVSILRIKEPGFPPAWEWQRRAWEWRRRVPDSRSPPSRLRVEALQRVYARTGFTEMTEGSFSILRTQHVHHSSDTGWELKSKFLQNTVHVLLGVMGLRLAIKHSCWMKNLGRALNWHHGEGRTLNKIS